MAKSAVSAVIWAFEGKVPHNLLNKDLFEKWQKRGVPV